MIWQPVRPEAISWREWDDEFVVYNDDSGSTHHLNVLGGEMLLALLHHPAGIDEAVLLAEVAQRFDAADNGVAEAEMRRVLDQFRELQIAFDRNP